MYNEIFSRFLIANSHIQCITNKLGRQGEWYPQKPTEEWAFDVSKQRWFRNTNDSLLFQTDDTSGSINGAFHPDFRMHAFIADVLAEEIRQKWK